MRVLVTVKPRMYREAISLALHHSRPHFEVMLAPAASPDGQAEGFRPHVLVRNDTDAAVPERVLKSVVCRVEVLFTDSMAARVSVGDRSFTIEDVRMDDLLALVDEAEGLVSRSSTG